MIDVKNPKCIFENCKTRPSFNFIIGLYCATHKLESMIDITNNMCIFENCLLRASYNFENKLKPIYCKTHMLKNMIDIAHKNVHLINVKQDLILIMKMKLLVYIVININ